jgi:hypothetical protein
MSQLFYVSRRDKVQRILQPASPSTFQAVEIDDNEQELDDDDNNDGLFIIAPPPLI